MSFKPQGRLLKEYTVGDQSFSIFLNTLTSPQSVSLFQNVQSFGYWFIDGASEIVVTDDSPHRWLMLTIFTTVQDHPAFVGYCLLYVFSNPFQFPPQSLRLCQILILPPFQKQGHSTRVFDCVYEQLMHMPPSEVLPASYSKEIDGSEKVPKDECSYAMYTVEDPCEDFTFVRDVYDCRLLRRADCMKELLQQDGSGDVKELTENVIATVQKRFGIIPAQLQKCYNILLHHRFKSEESKSYRLYVSMIGEDNLQIKRQLAKKYRNELELIREKDVFKSTVQIYYDDTEQYYDRICSVVFKNWHCLLEPCTLPTRRSGPCRSSRCEPSSSLCSRLSLPACFSSPIAFISTLRGAVCTPSERATNM